MTPPNDNNSESHSVSNSETTKTMSCVEHDLCGGSEVQGNIKMIKIEGQY